MGPRPARLTLPKSLLSPSSSDNILTLQCVEVGSACQCERCSLVVMVVILPAAARAEALWPMVTPIGKNSCSPPARRASLTRSLPLPISLPTSRQPEVRRKRRSCLSSEGEWTYELNRRNGRGDLDYLAGRAVMQAAEGCKLGSERAWLSVAP
jgi:hypothetical protein